MSVAWRVEVFGGLRAVRGDEVVARFRTHKTGELLAYLAIHRRQAHRREFLIDLLWPDADLESGRNNLNLALSSLRRQLGADVLATDRSWVQMDPSKIGTDLEEFESKLKAALAPHNERLVLEALDLYRGPVLEGFFEAWAQAERERVRAIRMLAVARTVEMFRRQDDLARALDLAYSAVVVDPLSEEAQVKLIQLLNETGQASSAMRQCRQFERSLKRELGLEPSEAMRNLHRSISGSEYRTLPKTVVTNGHAAAICKGVEPDGSPSDDPALWVSLGIAGFVGRYAMDGSAIGCVSVSNPHGIAFGPDGRTYVCNYAYDSVVALEPDGMPIGAAARGIPGADGLFFGADGRLNVCAHDSGEIIAVDLATGSREPVARSIAKPVDGVIDAEGNSYVTSLIDGTLWKIDPLGEVAPLIASIDRPAGVALAPDGALYVCGYGCGRIYRVDHVGRSEVFAEGLAAPHGIAFARDGRCFIADPGDDTVHVLSRTGRNLRTFSMAGRPLFVAVSYAGASSPAIKISVVKAWASSTAQRSEKLYHLLKYSNVTGQPKLNVRMACLECLAEDADGRSAHLKAFPVCGHDPVLDVSGANPMALVERLGPWESDFVVIAIERDPGHANLGGRRLRIRVKLAFSSPQGAVRQECEATTASDAE